MQRRKLIGMARKLGWEIYSEKKGGMVADIEKINGWCANKGMFNKVLNKHDLTELPQLLSQFERVYKSYFKRNLKYQERKD